MRTPLVAVLTVACMSVHAQQAASERPSAWTAKQPLATRRDMVAAANPLAVDTGVRILEQGGNAIDAASAMQLVLDVVEPQSSGIGGGAFMLFHDGSSGLLTVYDGRETAPAAARPERFLDAKGEPLAFHDAVVGGRSVGVPGLLRMLELAHGQYGKLPWAQLFQPAIALAENGFAVSPRLHAAITADGFLMQNRAKAAFFNTDGMPLAAGQTLKNRRFAATSGALPRAVPTPSTSAASPTTSSRVRYGAA